MGGSDALLDLCEASMPASGGVGMAMRSGLHLEEYAECEDRLDALDMMCEMKAPSYGAPMMMAAEASAPMHMASSTKNDYYQSEAIRCTVNQVKQKKALRQSKKTEL